MPSCQLTTTFCDELLGMPRVSKTVNYFDVEIKGFMLEQRATGAGTFYFRYRDFQSTDHPDINHPSPFLN